MLSRQPWLMPPLISTPHPHEHVTSMSHQPQQPQPSHSWLVADACGIWPSAAQSAGERGLVEPVVIERVLCDRAGGDEVLGLKRSAPNYYQARLIVEAVSRDQVRVVSIGIRSPRLEGQGGRLLRQSAFRRCEVFSALGARNRHSSDHVDEQCRVPALGYDVKHSKRSHLPLVDCI